MANEIEMKIANAAAEHWKYEGPKTLEEAIKGTGKSEIASVIGIVKTLGLDDSIIQRLVGTLNEEGKPIGDGIIYTQENIPQDISSEIKRGLEGSAKYKNILDILSTVHDNWVKNNPDNFLKTGRNKERQFVPLEMLDWDEVVNDLVFLKPILEAAGMEVDLEALKREFEIRQKEYMIDNKIYSHEDLVEHLMKGSKIYGALDGLETKNGGNIDSLLQQQEIAEKMAGQMEERGVIAKTREQLAMEFLSSQKPELDEVYWVQTVDFDIENKEKCPYLNQPISKREIWLSKLMGKPYPTYFLDGVKNDAHDSYRCEIRRAKTEEELNSIMEYSYKLHENKAIGFAEDEVIEGFGPNAHSIDETGTLEFGYGRDGEKLDGELKLPARDLYKAGFEPSDIGFEYGKTKESPKITPKGIAEAGTEITKNDLVPLQKGGLKKWLENIKEVFKKMVTGKGEK